MGRLTKRTKAAKRAYPDSNVSRSRAFLSLGDHNLLIIGDRTVITVEGIKDLERLAGMVQVAIVLAKAKAGEPCGSD